MHSQNSISSHSSFMILQIFDLFDAKRNGKIDFGEFVRALSIFHPRTPEAEKIACKNTVLSGQILNYISSVTEFLFPFLLFILLNHCCEILKLLWQVHSDYTI